MLKCEGHSSGATVCSSTSTLYFLCLYFRFPLVNSYEETTEGCVPRWFSFPAFNSPSYQHRSIWRLQNCAKAPQNNFIKSTDSAGFFVVHLGPVPPGQRWPWKRGSGRRLLFLFPGLGVAPPHSTTEPHFCQDSTFQASRVRGFTLLMIDHLQTAPIRLVNPPPWHQLFHHKIDTKVNMLFSGI